MVSIACIVSTIAIAVHAHSWLECTDYVVSSPTQTLVWDSSLCHGRARCSARQTEAGFGADTGFNHHGKDCQCAYGSDGVTVATPTYTPGQRVCLAYPPKNHVADTCTNSYIPDNGVTISRTALGATNDDFGTKTYNHLNGEHKTGSIDYKGFQNCPNFCSNMDKALCTMCFDLESDIVPGKYSFKWQWEFNTNDFYSTCWEATIASSSGGSIPVAAASVNLNDMFFLTKNTSTNVTKSEYSLLG
uniref:Secreted protein n=1 Tax=Thraustotheca clavata TaxID=74557 RepID=A0A0A7CLZ3_9STRA|nr:secreted protein [Thraustotheca clavata]